MFIYYLKKEIFTTDTQKKIYGYWDIVVKNVTQYTKIYKDVASYQCLVGFTIFTSLPTNKDSASYRCLVGFTIFTSPSANNDVHGYIYIYIYLQMGTLGEYIYFCILGDIFYVFHRFYHSLHWNMLINADDFFRQHIPPYH
jgi:hypothetical protein